jgi:hypothetical protein
MNARAEDIRFLLCKALEGTGMMRKFWIETKNPGYGKTGADGGIREMRFKQIDEDQQRIVEIRDRLFPKK